MAKVSVTEKALREMMREAMFNKEFAGWSSNDEGPVNVDPNVDPSIAVTDPINPDFKPQTRTEFGVAVNQLVKDLPDTQMPGLFDTVKMAIDQKEEVDQEDEMKIKQAAGGTGVKKEGRIERAIRNSIRKILAEAPPKKFGPVVGDLPPVKKIPAGEHGGEYNRKKEKYHGDLKTILGKAATSGENVDDIDEPVSAEPKRAHAYKATALGGVGEGGATFEEIANELGFSVAGAKQAVDKALEKLKYVGGMDDTDLDDLVLTAMNDYINMLAKSGELSSADVQLMHDHPDITTDLDGFREFLHNYIRKERKIDEPAKVAAAIADEPEGEEEAPATQRDGTPPETAPTGVGAEAVPTAMPSAAKARKEKDTYKVYPWRGKRSVVRVANKLYGTDDGGALKGGGTTKFKGGDRARISRDGDGVKVGSMDSDHTQTWDPIDQFDDPSMDESTNPYWRKHAATVKTALRKLTTENAASMARERKMERPELYCPKCLWMTGGGPCPRHGGAARTPEMDRDAKAKSQATTSLPVGRTRGGEEDATHGKCGKCGGAMSINDRCPNCERT